MAGVSLFESKSCAQVRGHCPAIRHRKQVYSCLIYNMTAVDL